MIVVIVSLNKKINAVFLIHRINILFTLNEQFSCEKM